MARFARLSRFLFLAVACLIVLPLTAHAATLAVSPTSVNVQTSVGTNAPSQTVQVVKSGGGVLRWSVTETSQWLAVSPTSGRNSGAISVTFQTSTLPQGTYQATFEITSNGGNQTVVVNLSISGQSTQGPPVVTCPSNITVASPNGSPVAVTYTPTVSGGAQPVTVTGTPPSGSQFPVGSTTVSVTATGSDGQTASCSFTVTVTYSPPTNPSGVGPQSTITCPTGAVSVYPGTSIQNMVSAYAGGTTFCIRAGVHYLNSSITPKTGNAFIGEYGAALDGSGWGASESTQAAFRAHNENIDYVTIRNLVIRNMPQRGIHAFYYQSDHWTIEYNEIASTLWGVVFPSDSTLRNNYIHHNSSGGYLGTYAHNSLLENNEIAYNGAEQKVGESANVTFRNNFVHHNAGDGIWYDSNNTNALIEGNRVEDNGYSGIFFEIGSGATIRSNSVRRSGNVGVFISTSKNAQVYNNTLEHNFRGILYFVNCASVGGGTIGFDLANNASFDNTIRVGTQSGALANGFSWTQCTSTQASAYLNGSKNLTFSRNTYYSSNPGAPHWLWNGLKYWSEWLALGHDADGRNLQ